MTLFAVGEDVERPEATAVLRDLTAAGHEVENHSHHHRYDLTRLSRVEMSDEVVRGADAIERAVGRRPEGFRAPGYTVTPQLLEIIGESGARFDSSVFPCPAYYGAKGLALAWLAARGRRSAAILDHPRVLFGPTQPYRLTSGLWEVPIQVTARLRLPVIGSSLTLAGRRGARLLARSCRSFPLVNLELHALDFLDEADGLGALARHQPELRIGHARRLEALDAAMDEIESTGARFITLARAVAELAT